jgi:predicted deacylase
VAAAGAVGALSGRLLTVPGGGHGGFTGEQMRRAYRTIWTFLEARGVLE